MEWVKKCGNRYVDAMSGAKCPSCCLPKGHAGDHRDENGTVWDFFADEPEWLQVVSRCFEMHRNLRLGGKHRLDYACFLSSTFFNFPEWCDHEWYTALSEDNHRLVDLFRESILDGIVPVQTGHDEQWRWVDATCESEELKEMESWVLKLSDFLSEHNDQFAYDSAVSDIEQKVLSGHWGLLMSSSSHEIKSQLLGVLSAAAKMGVQVSHIQAMRMYSRPEAYVELEEGMKARHKSLYEKYRKYRETMQEFFSNSTVPNSGPHSFTEEDVDETIGYLLGFRQKPTVLNHSSPMEVLKSDPSISFYPTRHHVADVEALSRIPADEQIETLLGPNAMARAKAPKKAKVPKINNPVPEPVTLRRMGEFRMDDEDE